ncbi:hypothetical protein CPB86DRAFT_57614 [Serendipita vermifera]|nr:hypothetical protein CPB86DRAFT_57614 [Serendipita vermifera]
MELNPRLLDCLKFKVLKSLRFNTRAPTGPIRPASIPYTLTRLVLLWVKLIPEHSAGAEPHHLPNLSILEIGQGDIVECLPWECTGARSFISRPCYPWRAALLFPAKVPSLTGTEH